MGQILSNLGIMLSSLFSPMAAIFITILNNRSQWLQLSMTELNIIFLLLFSLNIILSARDKNNRHKLMWVIGAQTMAASAAVINYHQANGEYQRLELETLFSNFNVLWLVIFLITAVYLTVMIRRLISWTQEDWEALRRNSSAQSRVRWELWLDGWHNIFQWWQEARAFWNAWRLHERTLEGETRSQISQTKRESRQHIAEEKQQHRETLKRLKREKAELIRTINNRIAERRKRDKDTKSERKSQLKASKGYLSLYDKLERQRTRSIWITETFNHLFEEPVRFQGIRQTLDSLLNGLFSVIGAFGSLIDGIGRIAEGFADILKSIGGIPHMIRRYFSSSSEKAPHKANRGIRHIVKNVLSIALVVIVLLGYFAIPCKVLKNSTNFTMTEWLRGVDVLMQIINSKESKSMEDTIMETVQNAMWMTALIAKQTPGQEIDQAAVQQPGQEANPAGQAATPTPEQINETGENPQTATVPAINAESKKSAASTENKPNNPDNTDLWPSLALYTIIYVVAVSIFLFALLLMLHLFDGFFKIILHISTDDDDEEEQFFNRYSAPISILIVSLVMLAGFAHGKKIFFSQKTIMQYGSYLFFATIIVGILLIAIDLIQLLIEQSIESGSLLRSTMHLCFTVVINIIMEFVLGIFNIFRLQDIMSAIASFIRSDPQNDNGVNLLLEFQQALEEEFKVIREKRKAWWKRFKRRLQKRNKKHKNGAENNASTIFEQIRKQSSEHRKG